MQGTDTVDQERAGWGGPESVTVIPSPRDRRRARRRTERGRRVLETRVVAPGAAFGDHPAPHARTAPPRDLPTVPHGPRPVPPAEPVTVPLPDLLTDLLGTRATPDTTPDTTPDAAPRRPSRPPRARRRPRRGHRGRVALLLAVLALVVVTVTHELGPQAPPPPPVAAPAMTAPKAPPARTPDVDPTALARTATAAIDRLVQGDSSGHVSVAALDTATGQSFGYAADNPVSTASVVKLDILETLLLQHQEGTTGLGAGTRELATAMMQQSDNDAATSLWDAVGGIPGIAAANRRLGPRATTLDDHWGSTTTPASDQLALLATLHGSALLDPDSRSFAHDLMTHVAEDQRWGVSAAADPGTTPALKNGWVPVDTAGGRWVVCSVGIVTAAGHPVLLAVLSENQPSQAAGIRLVESMARIAAGAVTSRPEVVAAG